jgi:hypothetical protein
MQFNTSITHTTKQTTLPSHAAMNDLLAEAAKQHVAEEDERRAKARAANAGEFQTSVCKVGSTLQCARDVSKRLAS